MALHTLRVDVIGESGVIATFKMPREDEHNQPYTKYEVDVLAQHKAKSIGYAGNVKARVR